MDAGLRATGLLVAGWAANSRQSGSTVLDTDFHPERAFSHFAQAWRNAPQRPGLLHYVALLPAGSTSVSLGELGSRLAPDALTGLDDGFHRVVLQDLPISLTLCIGEALSTLGELRVQADHVLAGASSARWDKWWVKALARCCRRGTQLHLLDAGVPRNLLLDAGFEFANSTASLTANPDKPDTTQAPEAGNDGKAAVAVYAPRWQIKSSRRAPATPPLAPGRCAVVGAGLSGAAVAHALALRGWQVDVYDQHPEAAQGASGLPAGLVVPHISADDSQRSRLSRRGTRLMLAEARALLTQGRDWQQSGVLELGSSPIWHPHAGWVKPAQMVRAWLAQPGIQFKGNAPVTTLHRADGRWLLQGADARTLGEADLVVLANAHGITELLNNCSTHASDSGLKVNPDLLSMLSAMQQVHGTLSVGCQGPSASADTLPTASISRNHSAEAPQLPPPPALPTFPVNGNGSFLPGVPCEHGTEWFAGATYETDMARIHDVGAQHQANADKLRQLLPHHAAPLLAQFAQGAVRHWTQTRCVTHDRMPLVGPIDAPGAPGLWMCVGMGSRGLSFSALCAQLLVAQIGAEPWPVEASLARGLLSTRTRRSKTTT